MLNLKKIDNITYKQIDIMKHTIGFNRGRIRGTKYRRYAATMASESRLRKEQWLIHGCNAFDTKRPRSQPMSFWTEQDVLEYIYTHKISYANEIYGDICTDKSGKYYTTKAQRTGCVFCMFGCHLEKEPNWFQRLAESHPKLYQYCINGGTDESGVWLPDGKGLGLGKVLDYIGVDYK